MLTLNGMTDCVEKVGLPQAHAAIEKEGVVGACRVFGDGSCRGVGELVGCTDDETLELVLWIEEGGG